jgi:transcriptional regulator with XRE-family HTH domain
VGMWERGQREPDGDMLCRIADMFGVSLDYLLGRSGVPSETMRLEDVLTMYSVSFAGRTLTPQQQRSLLYALELLVTSLQGGNGLPGSDPSPSP